MSATTRAPVDPDVDLRAPAQRRPRRLDPSVLAVIALGGALGAQGRYAVSLLSAEPAGAWPTATWWTNIGGSLLLGAVMVVFTELTSPHRLVRPFLGVGVLGGFTTFSTAMVEVPVLVEAGRPGVALAYLWGTAVACLLAVAAGVMAVRLVAAVSRRTGRRQRT